MTPAAAAAAYARRGWPVHPLRPGSKVPATPHGLKDATTDEARVERYWAEHPTANIGLVTGVAFDVLDIDDDQAHDVLDGLWEAAGAPAGFLSGPGAHGPVVRTPRGGLHLYVAPTGLGNRAGLVLGADWRGQGGYVVAPPSADPRGPWEWAEPYGPDTPLPAAPGWLLDVLRPPAPAVPHSARPAADTGAYARRALENECGRLLLAPAGQRNDQLCRSAFNLGQLVAGGALDPALVIDTLAEAALRAGLAPREVEATIASGIRAGAARPRQAS